MSWEGVSDTLCPIARGLSIVGERWTLLIMRELSMDSRRFDDIQAQTGMSSHLLSLRLKQLEEDGVIERRAYSERPKRYEYFATQKGKELDPILLAIRAWGLKWGEFEPDAENAVKIVSKTTGEVIDKTLRILGKSDIFSFDDTESTLSDAYSKEREHRRDAFKQQKYGKR